jgi:hypothetical protein
MWRWTVRQSGIGRSGGSDGISQLAVLLIGSLADFPLLIAISERQNTSVSPAIYPELSGTLVIISHIVVSGPEGSIVGSTTPTGHKIDFKLE